MIHHTLQPPNVLGTCRSLFDSKALPMNAVCKNTHTHAHTRIHTPLLPVLPLICRVSYMATLPARTMLLCRARTGKAVATLTISGFLSDQAFMSGGGG